MTDTTPEALDALIAGLHDAARSIEFDSDRDLMTAAADTIAALRAASVAMRERAADAVYRAMTALGGETAKARVEASIREFADEEPFATANWLRDLIRALPLDAPPSADRCCRGLSPEECATVPSRHCDGLQPAPVDPVAEAARVLLEQDAELPIGPNGYCLPSGLTFSPNGRIIGIDDDLAVFEGYDGPLAPPPGTPVEDGDWYGDLQNIPQGDKAALARMMIGRWTQFAGNALAQETPHD
jgi:hypothetical protein